MAAYVSFEECERMRQLSDSGLKQAEIARRFDRDQSTVSRHCTEYCLHATTVCTTSVTEPSREQITTAIRSLANEIECVPTREDWDHWTKRCCASATVTNIFEDWWAAVAAADLPTVASHAPRAVRVAAFNQPALAGAGDD